MRAAIIILGSVFSTGVSAYQSAADLADTLNAELYSGVLLNSKDDFSPLYLVSNNYGEVDEQDAFFLGGELSYVKAMSHNFTISTGFSFRNDLLSSHFLKLSLHGIYFKAGRVKETIGGLNNDISSGSMALSKNARPVPMIAVGLEDYLNVPYTAGYFQVKGSLSHRWLEENRYISNALLHGKTFYLRLNLDKLIGFKASSGVVHFAQYGGISPQGDKQPSGFSDYLRVFRGAGIPNPNGTTQGESNGLGNHLGIIETLVEKRLGKHNVTINYQKPFDDEGGIQYISLTDYLFGIEWKLPEKNSWLEKVYVEWIQTKWQGGPGLPDPTDEIPTREANFGYDFGQRDDTYNNWLYRSGWTYEGLVLGNPLFLTHDRTLNFLSPYPAHQTSIANNRIRSLHIGVKGAIKSGLSYRGLFTYTENFGTYAGIYDGRFSWNGVVTDPDFDYPFKFGKVQKYMMLELTHERPFKRVPLNLKLQLAKDFGMLYRASGLSFSVHYELKQY
ncbi:MAG: capsule assembly Wzi family protein [Roseivirga sp.]|nr:capsule assembly Wzi family protein [Roseivirga sp.]